MHRFPPLEPQHQSAKRPILALAVADLPLGEVAILSLVALLLALA